MGTSFCSIFEFVHRKNGEDDEVVVGRVDQSQRMSRTKEKFTSTSIGAIHCLTVEFTRARPDDSGDRYVRCWSGVALPCTNSKSLDKTRTVFHFVKFCCGFDTEYNKFYKFSVSVVNDVHQNQKDIWTSRHLHWEIKSAPVDIGISTSPDLALSKCLSNENL